MKNDEEEKLSKFTLDGKELAVAFSETVRVKEGVICDTYTFVNDPTKDLAIVTVAKGASTPLQRVLLGDKTTEGFIEGSGHFDRD